MKNFLTFPYCLGRRNKCSHC